MTIREIMQAELDAAKFKVLEIEDKMAALESESGSWLDKEEAEVKSFFQRMASHFPWVHVDTPAETTVETPVQEQTPEA